MAEESLYDHVATRLSINPGTRTNGTANGSGVDRQTGGFQGATMNITAGTITDGTHTISVQDSDDNASFAAVPAGQLVGGAKGTSPALTSADTNSVVEVGVLSARRYLRASAVTTGATTGGIFSASFVLGFPRNIPVGHP